jgi:hypothetical protein
MIHCVCSGPNLRVFNADKPHQQRVVQQTRIRAMEKNLQGKLELTVLKCNSRPDNKRSMTTECRVMWDEIRELTDTLHKLRMKERKND